MSEYPEFSDPPSRESQLPRRQTSRSSPFPAPLPCHFQLRLPRLHPPHVLTNRHPSNARRSSRFTVRLSQELECHRNATLAMRNARDLQPHLHAAQSARQHPVSYTHLTLPTIYSV